MLKSIFKLTIALYKDRSIMRERLEIKSLRALKIIQSLEVINKRKFNVDIKIKNPTNTYQDIYSTTKIK